MELFRAKKEPVSAPPPSQAAPPPPRPEPNVAELERKLRYTERLNEITNRIHAAHDLDNIIVDLKDDIISLFDADRITIYATDNHNEIFSKFKEGEEVKEIRVPVNSNSIAGFSAFAKKLVNVRNAYDDAELKRFHSQLRFDKSWDEKTKYRTQQILAAPILYERQLMGVIQLINKKNGEFFSREDEASLIEIGKILGIAFFNQSKMAARRRPGKFEYLVSHNILTEKELNQATASSRELRKNLADVLVEDFKVNKQDIGNALSEYYGCEFYQYREGWIVPEILLRGLNLDFLAKQLWAPVEETEGKLKIVIDDPQNLIKTDTITKHYGRAKRLEFMIGLPQDILKLLEITKKPPKDMIAESSDDILGSLEAETVELEDDLTAGDEVSDSDSSIVKLANQIIREAFNKGASDIHIEPYPGKRDTDVRIRIDGVCQKYLSIPANYSKALVSRFKIMSRLDIAEKRKPQDGKIKFPMPHRSIELRVATIPTQGGQEDIVMRILAASEPIPLDKMGFSERNIRVFKELLAKPYGIVLVVGPTGSGKTTTLHSGLGFINTPERKIWTAEDPVEITQVGLRQVQVQSKIGFTFAAAMRAFLRADPDVIMVGEMRDEETAGTGIEASLTGHLVFSTLHTNSAPETITRLLDMGMDPFNFADALLGILAQRLIRTLCKECKEAYHPTEAEFHELRISYGEEWFEKNMSHVKYDDNFKVYKPAGCPKCNNSGYKGRMGIHELLVGTDEMKSMIQRKAKIEEMRALAMQQGMTTLLQDGIAKVISGHADFKHVRGVCIK